ncbi:PhzF family phenazine biosynthesis protein [Caballeronia mineralivorans]|uniref:PhzF family phenazine biosynthesis protein n=1 Tax=Caballeronia mineralivorans TaxID=2010198 RepID=UPI0023F42DFC|nr:PhzF family phenazine biosynthesis protein [Caballeronia mineralivorans]MDB5787980.1 PhzF family phenazine biosynthesis protein [Caballeronia mineralivorans]MEA3099432.1 trans-2,3-dihydro-3-hydroxyanthranilate isomerase [Caballeronia mineralivorans]
MNRRYVTADVFTDKKFKGNPVAVVLDADGLSTNQMQAIAAEFAYSETTFVLPPRNAAHTAWVRIFTPSREIPFAGHPNIGTAFVLAARAESSQTPLPDQLVFEEAAGLVPVTQLKEEGRLVGAELIAPEPLARLSQVPQDRVAACLSLDSTDILVDAHAPQVASVGLPFLLVELASRDALRRCTPNLVAYKGLLPIDGAVSIYAYTRDVGPAVTGADCELQARMFTPRMTEDPATGSATAAAAALLAQVRGQSELVLRVGQGVDMGRPSVLIASVDTYNGKPRVRIGGKCVSVMEGSFRLDAES